MSQNSDVSSVTQFSLKTQNEDSMPLGDSFFGPTSIDDDEGDANVASDVHQRIHTPRNVFSASAAYVVGDNVSGRGGAAAVLEEASSSRGARSMGQYAAAVGGSFRSSAAFDGDCSGDEVEKAFISDGPNAEIYGLIAKLTRAWVSECAVPELTSSIFLTPEGTAISDILRETDEKLRQTKPSLDCHSRLQLCLNERALKRICHIVRLLKIRRRAKILMDPFAPVVWQTAVQSERRCEFPPTEDIGEEQPLEPEEYKLALGMHQHMDTTMISPPLLGSHYDVLHFEVASDNMSRQKFLDAAVTAASVGGNQLRLHTKRLTENISRVVDSAIRKGNGQQGHNSIQQRRESIIAGTPTSSSSTQLGFWGSIHSAAKADPLATARSFIDSDGGVPPGSVLTLDYAIAQDLFHEGHLAAYT